MKRTLLALTFSTFALTSFADEVTDAVDEGLSAYKAGDLGTAAGQWEYAAQLARQAKADKVAAMLPKPMSGWEGDEADSNAAGSAMFGGGISVSRQYTRGDDSVSIQLTMDSPMLQGVIGIVTNPQLAAMSGQKVKKIKGNPATVEVSDNWVKLQIVVNNAILIAVEGSPEDAVTEYANAIDYKGLAALN